MKYKFFLCIFVSLWLFGCAKVYFEPQPWRNEPIVKVLIGENLKQAKFGATSNYEILSSNGTIFKFNKNDKINISTIAQNIFIENLKEKVGNKISIAVYEWSDKLLFNGNSYHGVIDVINNGGKLTIINKISVEDYLRGVLPSEIGNPTNDAEESVKSQAVTARTYAIKQINKYNNRVFHLYADTRDQVYPGTTGENSICDKAISETWGVVITHTDTLIKAYYHSTCGGRTEKIEDVWTKNKPIPYLTQINDKSYCKTSPYYRWSEKWSVNQFENILINHLPEINKNYEISLDDKFISIKVKSRSLSGRATALEIKMKSGVYKIPAEQIRFILRTKYEQPLWSNRFKLEGEYNGNGKLEHIIAKGAGFGHGVGMCQWGAIEMSKAGYSYREILETYYPGTEVKTIY